MQAPGTGRPDDYSFNQKAHQAMRDQPSPAIAWLVTEARRARDQERLLLVEVELLRHQMGQRSLTDV
jgi:hypothetical protein